VSDVLEVGPMEFVVGSISLSAITLAANGWLLHDASESLGPCGSQGGPLSQGCVANASTVGARMQQRPSTLRASRVVAAVMWYREVT
jgi:hypothetical protein